MNDTETTTYSDSAIEDWQSIFGASAGTWEWWNQIVHLTGDWDTPGRVRLSIEDPDSDAQNFLVREFEASDIFRALATATEKYPHLFVRHPQYGDLDLDANSADIVLQVALFGEAVYG